MLVIRNLVAEADRLAQPAILITLVLLAAAVRIPHLLDKTIIELKCSEPVKYARLLKDCRGIDSVQIFGDRLHLAGADGRIMRASIEKKLHEEGVSLKLSTVSPSIEDVFVNLMQ